MNENIELNTFTDSNGTVWVQRDQIADLVESNARVFNGKLGMSKCVKHLSLFARNLRSL